MYKVFINEREICFTKALENFNDFENVLVLRFFHAAISEFLVDLLLNGKRIATIFIVTPDPNAAFESFQHQFKSVDAAGGLVQNQEGEVLVIERLGKWDLPKGKLEKDESKEEGAQREVEEECGVNQLKLLKALPTTYHMYEHKDKIVFKRTYWFLMETTFTGQLVPQTEEQITAVQWVSKDEIAAKVLGNTYHSLLPIFREFTS